MLRREEGSFLVFARTKHGADRLSKKLACQGVKSAAIHGDRSQNQRNQALRGFQEGQYRVLVATDIAARGIHVDGISHVVNYDLPQVPEDFIHRVGRTGRAGAHGTAHTFGTRSERGEIARIERTLAIRMIRLPIAGDRVRAKARRAGDPYSRSEAGTAALAYIQALAPSRSTPGEASGELAERFERPSGHRSVEDFAPSRSRFSAGCARNRAQASGNASANRLVKLHQPSRVAPPRVPCSSCVHVGECTIGPQ